MSGILQAVFQNLRSFITVPGAPTIGTATAGNTTASVNFTAPSSDGGSAITGYTATSNPSSITGTNASSPITVTGLTNGTSYTFSVIATNAIGSGPASAASNSVIPAPAAFLARYFSSSESTYAQGIRTDSSGNIIVSAFKSVVIFDKSGNLTTEWSTTPISANSVEQVNNTAVDSSGNKLIGFSADSGGFGLTKYNSSNTVQWSRRIKNSTSSNTSWGGWTAFDSSGNIYVTGQTSIGGAVNQNYPTLVKFDTSGTFQWRQTYSGVIDYQSTKSNALVIDSGGNPIVATRINAAGSRGLNVVIKYDSTGAKVWGRQLYRSGTNPGTTDGLSNGLAIDSSDNVYVTGVYDSASTGQNAILAKYNSSGAIQWQRKMQSGNGGAITIDSSANLYVGLINGSPQTFTILKYNSSGTLQWQRKFACSTLDLTAAALTFDVAEDSVLVAGLFNSATPSALIVKYPASGSITGTYSLSGSSIVISAGTIVDAAGDATDANGSFSANVRTPTSADAGVVKSSVTNSTALINI